MYAGEETPLQTAQVQNTRTAGSSFKRLITLRILGLIIVGVGLVGAISFGILSFSSVDLPKKQDVSQELSFRSFDFSKDTYKSEDSQGLQDWTIYFSETGKTSTLGPFNAHQCSAVKRCDEKRLRYFREIKATDRQGIYRTIQASVRGDESFTLDFSDDWTRYYQDCTNGKVVTTLKCKESWCDNLSLGCSTPNGWVIDTASISSEEQCSSNDGDRHCECPANTALVGMECHHSYCGTVVLRCADVYVIDKDDCDPNPCGNGQCRDKWGEDHICDCDPGYAGELECTEINECNPNPCLQEAQCIDRVNDYECKCPYGYEGKICQITSCTILDNGVTTSQYLIHEGNRELVIDPEEAHAAPGDLLETKCSGMFTLMDDQTFELLERSQNATCYPDVCAGTEDGIGLYDDSVDSFTVFDEAECCWRCGHHPGCRFWTFVKNDNMCYLKSSNEDSRDNGGMISGSLSTQGGGGWDKSVDVSCILPAADIQFSGRSIMSHFSSDKRYEVFDAAVRKLEFDFDGTVIYENILSNRVTGNWTTSLMLTDQPGMREYLQGATFYQMGYSLHGDGDDNIAWTQPGTTHCGCEQPAELAAENTFLSHHPGCFEILDKVSRILKESHKVWTPTGDTYVKKSQGDEIYGAESTFLVKTDNNAAHTLTRYAYVKFQIPCPIHLELHYILKLYMTSLSKKIDIYLGTEETFDENTLNWDTKPAREATALCTGLGEDPGWVFCDITSRIVEDYSCGEDIYFAIKCNEVTSSEVTVIVSRENENASLWPRIEAIGKEVHCKLGVRWGPNMQSSNDMLFVHEGAQHGRPFYSDDQEGFYLFHDPPYWKIGPSLGDSIFISGRVKSNALSGQDIFGTWEVYNSETDSHEPTPSLVVGCIPYDPDASWVYRGFRTFVFPDNTNGKCSEKCREFYPAEFYDDLFVSTSGVECICSIFEPTEKPMLSEECNTECPGDTSLYPSTCGGESDDDSTRIADVYRANTVSNAGFLPEYSYPGIGDQTAQHQLALSGAPRDFEVTQKRGGILELKFKDSSTCEDRFEYHQTDSIYEGWNNLLDFDLELVTRQQCGFEYTVEIPESVGPFEDPTRQFLAATKSYEFSLRMNTANKNAEGCVQTSAVSYIFTAFWESVLTGVVLTRGQNPVFGVAIQVYMPDGENLDPVFTDMSGTYEIWLHGHFPENEQIFRVQPSLEMHEVAHEFECGSFGKCTTIDHALQMNTKLSDLQLRAQTLDFIDVTIADIRGTVYVREPSDPDMRCPEADVRICIHYIHPERVLDEKSDCVVTLDDGQYTLQIPVMTATVEITAERLGVEFPHNFMTEDQSDSILFEDHLFEKEIVEQNFYDVTSRKITASVYGGTPNCKDNILDWKLAAVPENCPTMEYATYYDASTVIFLGAQEYTLMFLGEETVPGMEGSTLYDYEMEFSIDDIYTYFEFYQPLVNLTDVDPVSVPDFAFAYHLPATISVSNIEDEAIIMGCEGSRDFLSLQHGETYDISISVSEVYSKDPNFNSFCSDAPGTLDIFGLPQRGEHPPPGCSDPETGFRCQLDISYDTNTSKSEVSFQITPTSPSLTSKFLAFDFITTIESDDFENIDAQRYVESIFVMGTRKLEPGTQVPLPEHIPLLIVREPPGDGSYSFLSRGSELSVNIAVSSESGDLYDFAYYLGGGVSKEMEAGVGIYDQILKIVSDSGVPVEGNIDHLRSYAKSATLNLVIEEEYTTPGGGGTWFGVETTEISKTMTDMFLTPAFNLEVSEAQIFDLLKNDLTGECTRDETRSYTWELPDDLVDYEEGQAIAANIFSWYSEYHVVNYKIPELERMISTHGDDCPASCMTDPDCDIEMSETCYDEDCLNYDCPTKLLVLQDSLLGWNDTLTNNQNLKDRALPISAAERLTKDDKIKSYADATHPYLVKESVPDNQAVGTGRSPYSIPTPTSGGGVSLPPRTFYDDVNDILNHHYPATFSNKNDLRSVPGDVHMMTFSGGGSAYTYSYTSSESGDYESKKEDSTTTGGGFSTDYQLAVVPGLLIHASMKHLGSVTSTTDSTKTTEASGGITTSFTLSDDDIGDDFTIDIHEDENGWLYFKTAGGKSSCPHESDTTARQIFTLSLNLKSGDYNDVNDLAPDEVVHWDLIVSNESPTFDAYNMNLELWSDNEGLIVFVNGLPFIDAYGVNIDASTSYEVHITAQRPVGIVDDFYVQFKLSSECEPMYAQYVDCSAHYISLCPEARFSETDPWVLSEPTEEDDEEFLKITAVNDLYRTNPWGPTSEYIYEEVVDCRVLGSDSPFDNLGHGENILVTCSVDCLQSPGDVIGCPKDGGYARDDSSICTAAIASDVMNDFGEFLLIKRTDEAEYAACESNGVSTITGETSSDSFIFEALPEDKLEIFARHRTLSPFGTMAWDPAIDFNFAHFTMNRNGRTQYIWNPSPNLDGDFELQLVTICASGYATDRAESTTWIGSIDRSPPKVVPFPEPQDMVYQRGDEISFQFNEAIVCDFSENHSESKACWKESPTSECSPITHSVFCPEQGKDGKVHFLIDRIEDYVGDYIEISVLKIQDLHMMENQLPDPYTFLVANTTTMLLSLLSLESPSLMLLSNFHEVDLFSTQAPKSTRELFYSDDHTKVSLGDSLVAVTSFQLADVHPESDYLPQFVDCSLTYSIEFGREKDLEEQQCSIAFRSGKETVVHKWENSGVSVRTFTSALNCAYDEYIKFTFRSMAPKSESSSPCMWLNTQMEIEHKLPSHEHYKQELSKILKIVPDNLQAKESQSVDLLSKSNEEQVHKKVFEIAQPENDGRTFRDIVVALEGALQNPVSRMLYPLSSRSQIQYELPSEPKVCRFEDLSAPRIAFDKSEMSTQNLRVVVNADARYKRLEFSFQDAPDRSAQFVYEAGRKPISSGFWTPHNLDKCSSEFELKLPWSHLREHDVLGVGSLDENSLVYEITLNVESWEVDKFGGDYEIAVHSLKFRVILERPTVNVEISASESVQLEATPQARIGEGLHIDFFVSQLSINGDIWSISNVLQHQYEIRSDLDISLANTHQGRRQNNEPNGFFEVEIISKRCEFVEEAFDLVFVNEAGQMEIILVTVSSTSLCAKVVGSPCLTVPSVENSKDISHCRNTEHGKSCELNCQPGYVPSAELTCVDGKWEDEALCILKYFLTKPAPFLSTWSECSQHSFDDGASNAHLAVIHSDQENQEIDGLCQTTEAQRCFIGVVPVISDLTPSLEWIDGTELLDQGFQKWEYPTNIVKTETAYISSPTGLWGQTLEITNLPAVCQIGKCIPSPAEVFLTTDIPTNLQVPACTDSLPLTPDVFATNGCDVWQVPVEAHIKTSENPNNYTIYNTWALTLTRAREARKQVNIGQFDAEYLWQVTDVIDEPPRFTTELVDVSMSCEEYSDIPPDVEAIDDCDERPLIKFSQTKSSDECPFVVYREWIASDGFGQITKLQQGIRVGF